MNKKLVIAVIVGVALILGGASAYAINQNNKNEQAAEKKADEAIAMKKDEAMQKPETGEAMAKEDAMKKDEATDVMSKGAYVSYADYTGNKAKYDNSKVVYFFNAKWCPTCQALTKDITANTGTIPAGTTIVSVDYDQYTDLKKQYGVTYQHTLVQVDKNGTQVKKWSGSPNLSELLSQVKG